MKTYLRIIVSVAVVALLAVPAEAQFRLGIKGGIALNDLSFNSHDFDATNRMGYCAGITAELQMPITGLCIDGSALYTHRNTKLEGEYTTFKRDYLDVPVNLKLKLGLAGMGLIKPFVYTGPDFAFLLSDEYQLDSAIKNRTLNTSWNVGGGVELIDHLQVAVNYNMGLSRAMEYIGRDNEDGETIKGHDRCWTVTATYYF